MIASFDRPAVLLLLFAVPLLWAGLRRAETARRRRLAAFAGRRGGLLATGFDLRARALRPVFFAAGCAAVVAALAGPRGALEPSATGTGGADVVVALDVSRSMLAQDAPPSRLARARASIDALANAVRGDRLGLVVFAGEARLLVPLTRDAASFRDLAATADPLSVTRGGTDLGAALDAAVAALPSTPDRRAAVVLVTDGEDHVGRGRRAAARCAERGVEVHVLGLGSTAGAKIPVTAAGGDTRFLRDRAGREVVAARDPATLAAVARAGGGTVVDDDGPATLANLLERRLRPGSGGAGHDGGAHRRVPLQGWLLGAALLFFLGDLCSVRSRRS